VSRFLAAAIDFGVVLLGLLAGYLAVAVVRFLLAPRDFTWPTPGRPVLIALFWGSLVLYLALSWATTGRTVGKQLMGLRVVSDRGDRLRFGLSLLRALFCAAVPITLFWSAVSRSNRSVADLVFRTSVIYDWRLRATSHGDGLTAPARA
jgi:uncharacterized RDD family membrane protein YckC